VSGQLHAPAALPQREEPTIRIRYEGEWAPDPVWTLYRKKSNPCPSRETKPDRPARSLVTILNECTQRNRSRFLFSLYRNDFKILILGQRKCNCYEVLQQAHLTLQMVAHGVITRCYNSQDHDLKDSVTSCMLLLSM